MFSFSKRKTLSISEKEFYLDILHEIRQNLNDAGLLVHANIVGNLILLLEQNKIPQFIKLLNGVDMWGGSGAVWEVYIENKVLASKFERSIIKLVDLMNNTNMSSCPVNSIRKLFLDNLKNDYHNTV